MSEWQNLADLIGMTIPDDDAIGHNCVEQWIDATASLEAERDRARDRCVLLDSKLAEIARLLHEFGISGTPDHCRLCRSLALAEGDAPPARLVQAAKNLMRERREAALADEVLDRVSGLPPVYAPELDGAKEDAS